jgi:glycosyltransferase involved in cell wall biosynthesis
MRIGLVTPFFLPDIGGANIYCYELARALAGHGHEVHLFTVRGALDDPAYVLHPVLTGDLAADLRTLAPFDMDVWHALFFFHAPLAFHKPNVFVTGYGDDCFSFRIRYRVPGRDGLDRHLLWRLPPRARSALLDTLDRVERAMNRRRYAAAIRRCRQVIVISTFTRERLVRAYPGAARKTTVIPPGVSDRFFARAPTRASRDGRLNLLTVTRLDAADRIKNVHGVIGALAALKDEFPFLYRVVSGSQSGAYKQELQEQIQRLGLGDRVFLEGRKTDEELLALYQAADLFVLASYAEPENFEGFGIVFLEANACGVPVLSSRDGGMADYIVEGENGFYVSDPSPAGIGEALRRYLAGGVRFDRERVRTYPERYRWRQIAQRVLDVYRAHGAAR